MKIAVLVSGGVDSACALKLLIDSGFKCTAFYLKIWLEDELDSLIQNCPWEEDLNYVRKLCEQLKVELKIISLQQEYHSIVVNYMLDELKKGYTPNPDVLCNQHIKFGIFYSVIGSEFDFVATGHYAQIKHFKDYSILKKSVDLHKDQTYFLCNLVQAQLKRALFPIGHLKKSEVRELAKKFDLPQFLRKDSQGICFLGKFKFFEFLEARLGKIQGDLIEFETGNLLGKHSGFFYFTIGQRHGIKLSGGPWYVVKKDIEKNIIFISKNYCFVAVSKAGMIVSDFNWILKPKENQFNYMLKFRHGAKMYPSFVEFLLRDKLKITLCESSEQGIAVGQFAVLYYGENCMGGGVITETF